MGFCPVCMVKGRKMPACLTHYLFARRVADRFPQAGGADPCAYAWGAQGPDFLFCHRYMRFLGLGKGDGLQTYGSLMHETKPSATLSAMREFLKARPDPSYRSYVQGFLCHYALDSTAHPYVNALAGELAAQRAHETTGTMHGEIESALDAIILRRETGKLPSGVNLKHMFPKNEGVQRRIARLYRQVLADVYQADVPEEELLRATRDAHFVFAAVTDRTGLKQRLFHMLERGKPHVVASHIVPLTERDDVDYANISRQPWGPDSSRLDFFQLFGQALDRAERLIAEFDTADLAALTEEKPFG